MYRHKTHSKERNIRISGPRLGHPSQNSHDEKKQERRDSGMRNGIEGTFGVGKRKYGLGRLMMKLSSTSESSIAMIILVMNLCKRLRDIFVLLKLQCQYWFRLSFGV